jgi:Family of unknown function (DUF6339)
VTLLVPRLDRETARELIAEGLHSPSDIAASMPDLRPPVTFSPVGGVRAERNDLEELRHVLVDLAVAHGMPGPLDRTNEFEGNCARILRDRLEMTPHEASHEEVWSYLTCCWLLDIAVWRFGSEADERRYIGNVNRNTFRRLWWRAEVLGPEIDLTRLGEDELVNIMERPTIAADRRLARAIAAEFLQRVEGGVVRERMHMMRDAMKRVLRLTPMVAFSALQSSEVAQVVAHTFDLAEAALNGLPAPSQPLVVDAAPAASPDVVRVETLVLASHDRGSADGEDDFELIVGATLDIARRTGRVTSTSLREVVPITAAEGREVFRVLIERGELVRHGVRRGTYYVLADATDPDTVPLLAPSGAEPTHERPRDSALRQLLQRRST